MAVSGLPVACPWVAVSSICPPLCISGHHLVARFGCERVVCRIECAYFSCKLNGERSGPKLDPSFENYKEAWFRLITSSSNNMKFSTAFVSTLFATYAAAAPLAAASDKIPVPFPKSAVNQIVTIDETNAPIYLNNSGTITLFLVNTTVKEESPEKRELGEVATGYEFNAAQYMKRESFPIENLVPESSLEKREAKKNSRFLTYWFFQPIMKRGEEETSEVVKREAKKNSRFLTYWFFQPIMKREEDNVAGDEMVKREAKKNSRFLTYWFFQPIMKREGGNEVEKRDAKKNSRFLTYWFFQPIM